MSNIKRTNIGFISPNKLRPGLFPSLWLLPWTFLKCNTFDSRDGKSGVRRTIYKRSVREYSHFSATFLFHGVVTFPSWAPFHTTYRDAVTQRD